MLIGIPIPNNFSPDWKAVLCWLRLKDYEINFAQGPYIYENRNKLFEYARLKGQSILFIDSDIIFTLEDIKKIEEYLKTKDAVTGLYTFGTSPYPPMVFKRIKDDYKVTDPPRELSKIDACGGGFLGVSQKVVQAMEENPFTNVKEGDKFHGEDISFSYRLQKYNLELWLDPNIKLGQLRTEVIRPR